MLTLTGYAIAVVGLAYVLLHLHPSQWKADLAGMTWWLVAAAVLLDISPRALEAVRWKYLLRPLDVTYRFLLRAIYVGTLYSGILPLSSGDVVRGVMVARHARTSSATVLSTVLMERLSDAAALALVVWITLQGLVLPPTLRLATAILEILVVGALAFVVVLALKRSRQGPGHGSLRRVGAIGRWLRGLGAKIAAITGSFTIRGLLVSIPMALGMAVLRVSVLWMLLTAYHLQLSFLEAAGVFGMVVAGTFLPNTPGNVGSWQFFCALGLGVFGVEGARASGFSLVAFAIWTVPPVLIGTAALFTSPFSWSDLRHAHARQATEPDTSSTDP